jgi:glutaminyl-peptide cyclotransferase
MMPAIVFSRWSSTCGRLLAALALMGGACANRSAPNGGGPRPFEQLVPKVLRVYPHDVRAFTQGLVYFDGGLYESTGQYGQSSLRRVDPDSGAVESSVDLDAQVFAEGLARVNDELHQLTWKNGLAFVWKLGTFEKVREHSYQGEGWGLCYDGKRLIMSDGSERLAFRDPRSFREEGSVRVARAGQPVHKLNELECVNGAVYANVWLSDVIVRIDPGSGEVTGWIDASGLLTPRERVGADWLNGIAHIPERDTFLITGKLWPHMFEVKFVPAPR